jgi:ABC-type siderophore export system fused ATPase/permease subunit
MYLGVLSLQVVTTENISFWYISFYGMLRRRCGSRDLLGFLSKDIYVVTLKCLHLPDSQHVMLSPVLTAIYLCCVIIVFYLCLIIKMQIILPVFLMLI